MLAHEVLLHRLVGRRGEQRGFGQQLGLQRQQIAENARTASPPHRCAAGPELASGTSCAPAQPAVAVEARLGAHQPQRLRDRAAFGLQVVGAPQHHRDRFRQRLAVRRVAREQSLGLARAVAHREGARDAERIEAVQIAPGRQHLGACAADRRRAPGGCSRRPAHA